MLIGLQILLYCVLASILLAYLLISRKGANHRGLWIGLLASPLGFVAPYLLLMLIVFACHGTWPTDGIPVIDPIARILVVALLLIGPCIGPPLVVYLAFRFTKRNKSDSL